MCVCGGGGASHPSGAGSSWSAVRFGLAVARRLTFESPALHHALKTLPNASRERGTLISTSWLSDLKKTKQSSGEEDKRVQKRTHDLAVTSTY